MAHFTSQVSPAPAPIYAAHWPTVASYALLPNVSGSPTQDPALQTGDSCLVAGRGDYVCVDGTLGAAIWEAQMPVAPNEVLVRSEADLPAAVGGVITLLTNTVYTIRGVIALTAGNRILTPAGTMLRGRLSLVDQIVGNYNGNLISFTDPSSSAKLDVRDLTIQNTNTGASSYVFGVNAPNATLRVELCRILGGLHCLGLTAIANVSLPSVTVTAGSGGDAVRVLGTATAIYANLCGFTSSGTNGNGINLTSAAVVTTLTLEANAFIQGSASCVGVRKDAAATVTTAYLTRALTYGSGILNSGWDQGTTGWNVVASPPLPDSVAGGGSKSTAGIDFTQAFPVQNTWYGVTNGSAIYTLDPGSERFTLFSATNGEIRYVGTRVRRFMLQGAVNLSKTGTATVIETALLVNDSVVAATTMQGQITTTINDQTTMPVVVTLSPNDRVRIQMRNQDNTNSMTVHTAGITVIGLGS